jgi:hypothetical protein
VEQEDDPDAPHLHFMLECKKQIACYRVRAINDYFKDHFGRCQFFLMTPLKARSWAKYINKDVEANDIIFGFPHFQLHNITERIIDLDNRLLVDKNPRVQSNSDSDIPGDNDVDILSNHSSEF